METTKKILLVCNKKSSFLSVKIKAQLKEEAFEVVFSEFDVDAFSKIEEKPKLILLNFENIEEEDKQFLFYIRELCIEDEKRVYLCGHVDEVKEVAAILPRGTVVGTFTRPINITELVSRMNKEIDKYIKDEEKKHILVVDDSGEMLRTIREWLSDTYRVSIVSSGTNAILFLANNKPDLILLDYDMPLCTGAQIMEMIRAEISTSSIPIMFLTGKSDKESAQKLLSLKPEGYMLKTMKPNEIKDTIGKFFIAQKAKEYSGWIPK